MKWYLLDYPKLFEQNSFPFKQVSYLFLCMRPPVPKLLEEMGKIMTAVIKINPLDKIPQNVM